MIRVLDGDARTVLTTLPAASVHCVVTSPPYYGLRDYGTVGQLGLEATPAEYIASLVAVFREVRRVLRKDGTLWLNIGDSYAGGDTRRKDNRIPSGLKPKDLIGIPWLLAFALREDGWYLRSDIIYSKSNPMPESVTDRPTKSHEYLFLLTRSARYYYDADAIREPLVPGAKHEQVRSQNGGGSAESLAGHDYTREGLGLMRSNPAGRNKRSVWEIATEPFPEAHFATYPTALVEPCIKAGSSERGACPACGAPWARVVERALVATRGNAHPDTRRDAYDASSRPGGVGDYSTVYGRYDITTTGWRAPCAHTDLRCPNGCSVVESANGREEAITPASVSDVRDGVPPVETGGELLHETVLYEPPVDGRSASVSPVRQDVSADAEPVAVLQQVLFGQVGGSATAEYARVVPDQEGLSAHVPARSPDGIEGGLRGRAPAGDRGNHRAPVDAAGGSPSSERSEDGQPSREPGVIEQSSARWDAATRVLGDMSHMQQRVSGEGECPRCGSRLEQVPLAPVPSTILDPFAGAGTTLLVADRLDRHAIGIELSPAYAEMARQRLVNDAPLFVEVAS